MSRIIGERLKKVRIGLDYQTQAPFAEKLGITQTTLSKYENGTSDIPDELKIKISEFGISLHWLVTGESDMLISSIPAKSRQDITKSEGAKVPLLRQKVSCGAGVNWESEQNIQGYIDIFDMIPRLQIKRLFALCAEGSSMLGAGICDGDYVLFDGGADHLPRDGIYVFALDGEVYCKRLEFERISKKIKIYSVRVADLEKAELLRTLDMEDASVADRLEIFGRVVYWVHPNLEE
jgi:SOS-response transcriptional repressor LexA